MAKPTHSPDILIVDDTPANLRLLDEMLSGMGFRSRLVTSGRQALNAARRAVPDLLLLDIMMPGMDGFEVCREFKSDPFLRDIPILFLSAVTSSEDKVRAFSAGGIDFITKPFNLSEVEARVRTHLLIHQQKQSLEKANKQLRELEHLRDSLVHMVVHDMRSPLFLMELNLHLLGKAILANQPEQRSTLDDTLKNVRYLTHLVHQLLDVSRLEAGELPLIKTEGDLTQTVRKAVDSFTVAQGNRSLTMSGDPAIRACFDPEIVHRIVSNLVQNAFQHGGINAKITISVTRSPEGARVTVADDGPGIPNDFHEIIFTKFGQVQTKVASERTGIGLGLAFCRLAVRAHGGNIGVVSEPGKGATFWFTLPGTDPSIPGSISPQNG